MDEIPEGAIPSEKFDPKLENVGVNRSPSSLEPIPDGAIPSDQFYQMQGTQEIPEGAIPSEEYNPNIEKYGSASEQLKAGLENAAASGTFGLSTGAERLLGVNPEDIRARKEVHEELHPSLAAGERLGGFIASTLIPGAGEANIVEHAGAGTLGLLESLGIGGEGAGLLGKMGAGAGRMGVETALMQGGDEVSKYFAEDPSQHVDTAIANIGLSAVLGAGFGAGVGAISPLWKATKESVLGKSLQTLKDDVETGGMGSFVKKALSSLGGVSEENISKYLENREAINSAPDEREVYDAYFPHVQKIYDDFADKKLTEQEAKRQLNDASRVYKDQLVNKGYKLSEANNAAQEAAKTAKIEYKEQTFKNAIDQAPKVVEAVERLHDYVTQQSAKSYDILDRSNAKVDLTGLFSKARELQDDLRLESTPSSLQMADKIQQYVDAVKSGLNEKVKAPYVPKVPDATEFNFGANVKTGGQTLEKLTGKGGAGPTENLDNVSSKHLQYALKHDGINPDTGFEIDTDEARKVLARRAEKSGEKLIKEQKAGSNYIPPGGYEEPIETGTVDASKAKAMIQGLDRDSKYDFNASAFDKGMSRYYKQLRYTLDDELKNAVPEYREAMKPLSKATGLLSKLSSYGEEMTAARKISAMKNDINYKYQMPLLRDLEKQTGGNFVSSIESHADELARDRALESLPEVKEAMKTAEALKLFKNPEVKQEMLRMISELPEYKAHQEAIADLHNAIAEKEGLGGISPQNLETKLKAAMRGKRNVEEAIGKLPDFQGKKLKNVLENIQVKKALEGGHTNGSKNVNLYGGLLGGAAGMLGGHAISGIAGGAALGSFMDKYGHSVVKKILDAYLDHSENIPELVGHKNKDAIRYSIAKMLDSAKNVKADAFKGISHLVSASMMGEKETLRQTKNLFSGSSLDVKKPSHDDLKKLDEKIKNIGENPKDLMNVGRAIDHYMPNHSMAIAKTAASAVNYLNSQRPKPIQKSPLDQKIEPSKAQMSAYNRTLTIAQSPLNILAHIKNGTLIPSDIQTLHVIYPSYYTSISSHILSGMTEHIHEGKSVPYSLRQSLSLFLGQPLDSTMTPESIKSVQLSFAAKNQQNMPMQQNKKKGSPSKLNKMADSLMTSNQKSEQRMLHD